jgi:hypothetical protein
MNTFKESAINNKTIFKLIFGGIEINGEFICSTMCTRVNNIHAKLANSKEENGCRDNSSTGISSTADLTKQIDLASLKLNLPTKRKLISFGLLL